MNQHKIGTIMRTHYSKDDKQHHNPKPPSNRVPSAADTKSDNFVHEELGGDENEDVLEPPSVIMHFLYG